MRHHTKQLFSKVNPINLLPNMESLQLPVDLYWEGKTEPNSPPVQELFPLAEDTLFENCIEDDISNELIITADDLKLKLGLDESIELLSEDDMLMEIYDSKEENWNAEKFSTPVNDIVVDDYLIGPSITQTNPITKVYLPNSYEYLNDGIETYTTNTTTCFDNAILTQLTPPHSPPLENINIINNKNKNFTSPNVNLNAIIQPIVEEQLVVIPQQQQQTQIAVENIWPSVNIHNEINRCTTTNAPSLDIQREMEIVDEIVNTRVKELIDWHELEALSNSSNSSLAASTTTQANESIVEEDWFPTCETSYTSSTCASPASASSSSNLDELQEQQIANNISSSSSSIVTIKKRTRPYGRAIEDRKLRKKEQNKNAATRYRQKKKLEMEHVLTEEAQLMERNEELKRQLAARKSEAKYLKTLIREFYAKQQQQKQTTTN